jgi:hypothetical protein
LDAQQKKPSLHMVEIDPVGSFVDGLLILRIAGLDRARQERVCDRSVDFLASRRAFMLKDPPGQKGDGEPDGRVQT